MKSDIIDIIGIIAIVMVALLMTYPAMRHLQRKMYLGFMGRSD